MRWSRPCGARRRARRFEAKSASVMADAARAFIYDAMDRIEKEARTALAATADGDTLVTQLAVLRRFAKHAPLDTIAIRRRVAEAVLAQDRYPFEGRYSLSKTPSEFGYLATSVQKWNTSAEYSLSRTFLPIGYRFRDWQCRRLSMGYEMDRLGLLLHLTCTKGQVKSMNRLLGQLKVFGEAAAKQAKVRKGLVAILAAFLVLQVYFVRELLAAELLFGSVVCGCASDRRNCICSRHAQRAGH